MLANVKRTVEGHDWKFMKKGEVVCKAVFQDVLRSGLLRFDHEKRGGKQQCGLGCKGGHNQ